MKVEPGFSELGPPRSPISLGSSSPPKRTRASPESPLSAGSFLMPEELDLEEQAAVEAMCADLGMD